MTKQLLIYESVTPVSRVDHRDVAVRRTSSFAFAKGTNSVPLVDVEFAKAAVEMPIVFAPSETGTIPVALLGTARDQCAFVKEDGSWDGAYVPAFFRRYPFVFAVQDGQDRLTLCIDESFEGLNRDGVGERLFDSEGNETSYTNTVLRFAEEYQASFNRTQAFCDRLKEAGLLEDARVDYTLQDGRAGQINGFQRVNPEKLRDLPDEKVVELFRSGDLALIQLHLASMQLVERLVTKATTAMQPAGSEEAGDASDASEETAEVH
ncbi:SapC family protein [Histidinibacterium aquaticum]|uniref:SapC family protein n=1 Tax=Histidinibacterium aquaticum TaxID=2613962 RepID=A0A5J5GMF3_9RHOB|nr:SapC family protein [Histidinibacterium aquaticum]KAA9009471.1 SapC family protein [Histidinibacterium aquaticum]